MMAPVVSSWLLRIAGILLVSNLMIRPGHSFSSNNHNSNNRIIGNSNSVNDAFRTTTTTRLFMGDNENSNNNFFDEMKNRFNDMLTGNSSGTDGSSGQEGESDDNMGAVTGDDNNDNAAAGTSRIAAIPVTAIKPGGLRLFLMFYLMGQQNTPDPRSWCVSQTDEYILDYRFHDNTAILTISLCPDDDEIRIERVGSQPSTAYLMQETVILQGILDELDQCAFDTQVAEPDRLLILPEPKDAIDKARDALAFG